MSTSSGSGAAAVSDAASASASDEAPCERRLRVVIVGSGVAGLVTALALGDRHDVTIVTKSTIDESNTRYAQGGIAAAVMPGDTVASHVADTLVAGAGLSDPAAVQVLCAEGPDRIRDLIRWGVDFDRQHDDPTADFDAGLEGAHSFHRILHAGGDATGYEVEWALVRAVRASAARVLEQTFVADVVVTDGCATGLTVLHDGITETLTADAVVLASGGIGQLYPHTTNPSVTTGDGAAAALRAGAVLADVEFVQFHPTALAVTGSFLVSEAVRGDGAVLRNAAGERFMVGEHPLAELAPRDIVARAIASEMARTGAPVVLDATAIGASELERRFPTISAAAREHGFDWAHEPVPVAPAAHYLDGRGSRPTSMPAPRCPGCSPWGRCRAPGCTARTGSRRTRCSSRSCSRTAVLRRSGRMRRRRRPLCAPGRACRTRCRSRRWCRRASNRQNPTECRMPLRRSSATR